jgi:hypothetical protein
MRILVLASLLALPLGSAAMAEGLTFTGDNGGTIVKTRDCERGAGQATCITDTTYTGIDGQTAAKSRVRVTEPGTSATAITLTGPEGNTRTRKRLLTLGN